MRKSILARRIQYAFEEIPNPKNPWTGFYPCFMHYIRNYVEHDFIVLKKPTIRFMGFKRITFMSMSKSYCSMCTSACNALTC